MNHQGFVILEHTADLSLRAWGRDMRELIQAAAEGLLALLYTAAPPGSDDTRAFTVSADSPEMILQHALRELLYLMEDEALAPVAVAVIAADAASAELRAAVVPLADARTLLGAEVKAVTRHGLAIVTTEEGLETVLVFDV